MIPASPFSTVASLAVDPVAERYRQIFVSLDWSVLPTRDPDRSWPGPKPHSPAAYAKALLVKVLEGKSSIAALRRFLVEHPALVLEAGFRPVLDPTQPFGFDVQRTLPSERWLRHHQQYGAAAVEALLSASVHALRKQDPNLGQVVAIDATHHYAWVRQNNPNQTLSARFDRHCQPAGDPDCRLGGKHRHSAPKRSKTEAFWGYHSAIAAAPSVLGDVVLAVTVQPVVGQEITLFSALAAQTETVLGHPPTDLTADAAFDAWRVYDWVAQHGGMAAIPLNPRGGRPPRSPEGHPCCAMGYVMTPGTIGRRNDYQVQHYRCPLRGDPGAHCPHPRFSRGGCIKRVNLELGGIQRITLDRRSDAYQALYRKRTSVERLFSRLKSWGLDRANARRLSTVTTILLLGYLAINLTVLAAATPAQTAIGGPSM